MVKNQLEVYRGSHCNITVSDKSKEFYPTLEGRKKLNESIFFRILFFIEAE